MEFRNLGNSGLRISEIAYGNWLTHGSQVERETATACVRKALDVGITTFDTADAYAETRAESVLGEALAGERREGLEIFTKVLATIDYILQPVIQRDPAMTTSPRRSTFSSR